MPSSAEAPRAVRLSRPASLAVRLSGYPQAEGAKVELFLRRDARRGAAAAELPWTGEGAVVFEGLPAGLASVAAVVPGAPPAHLSSIRLLEGARTVVELDAPRGEAVRGTVVELGTERPLAGVRVELQPLVSGLSDREERAPFDAVVTAGDGRFSFDGAPVGKARALLTTEDGVRVHRDFVIIEGNGARELSLRVQPSASLAGRVLGRPEDLEGLELAIVASGDAGRVVGSASRAGRWRAVRASRSRWGRTAASWRSACLRGASSSSSPAWREPERSRASRSPLDCAPASAARAWSWRCGSRRCGASPSRIEAIGRSRGSRCASRSGSPVGRPGRTPSRSSPHRADIRSPGGLTGRGGSASTRTASPPSPPAGARARLRRSACGVAGTCTCSCSTTSVALSTARACALWRMTGRRPGRSVAVDPRPVMAAIDTGGRPSTSTLNTGGA